jgi:3-mercaptopyruvate sulfurtransferase SseA
LFTTLISTAELAAALGQPDVVICDVRHDLVQQDAWGEAEYAKAHVPGAQFVHVDRELSAPRTGSNGRHPLPTPEAAAALFARLGINEAKQVVAYDQGNGMYAARLWWMLRWLGHDAVAVLDGGYAKWLKEGLPVNSQVPVPRPSSFGIHRVTPTVNASGVRASVHRHTLFLIRTRCRPHPRRTQPAVRAERRGRRHIQTRRLSTRRIHRAARRRIARNRRAQLRLRHFRLPQHSCNGNCRTARHATLPGVVERMVRRYGAAGGTRALDNHLS